MAGMDGWNKQAKKSQVETMKNMGIERAHDHEYGQDRARRIAGDVERSPGLARKAELKDWADVASRNSNHGWVKR